MRHLLIENAESCHFYRHGIFWCRRASETNQELPAMVEELAKTIGENFSIVDIDGFDELFARDLWALNLDAELTFSAPDSSNPHRHHQPSTCRLQAWLSKSWIGPRCTPASCDMPRP